MNNISEIKNKERVINELMRFIRKVLADPQICPVALEVARKHIDSKNADVLIADELSSLTSVKIPVEFSDADKLFLQVLKDVVRDEQALY
ncbi:hypothetical protein [Nitrincola tapanii]|uniref:Uncharacterized protein n=1 Tax=Nitrincola tapanii TaxID=1708751 RepID=A0A5A9W2E7_9GAMM|nr:hypothetical protein [Nitrincola tapanii]KAA0874288.1 hypothetical protein E1H14_08405 [Nitrincola tapanii]